MGHAEEKEFCFMSMSYIQVSLYDAIRFLLFPIIKVSLSRTIIAEFVGQHGVARLIVPEI